MRRNPILSETDAFRVTVAILGLTALASLLGWLTAPLVGVVVFAILALAGLTLYMHSPERDRRLPLRNAAEADHPHGASPGTRHVIVVANEPLAGDELDAHIRGLGRGPVEVDVLAPVLSSRTHLAYTDIDRELREARERLGRSLAWARQQGFIARGTIGDTSPTVAIEDELRDFGADEVIVITSRSSRSSWQERAALHRMRDELDVQVVQMAVD